MNQMLDPATLQQALTQHGIPALVKTGTYCTSTPCATRPGQRRRAVHRAARRGAPHYGACAQRPYAQ